MRCIETCVLESTSVGSKVIKSNMRCIETYGKIEIQPPVLDKE